MSATLTHELKAPAGSVYDVNERVLYRPIVLVPGFPVSAAGGESAGYGHARAAAEPVEALEAAGDGRAEAYDRQIGDYNNAEGAGRGGGAQEGDAEADKRDAQRGGDYIRGRSAYLPGAEGGAHALEIEVAAGLGGGIGCTAQEKRPSTTLLVLGQCADSLAHSLDQWNDKRISHGEIAQSFRHPGCPIIREAVEPFAFDGR